MKYLLILLLALPVQAEEDKAGEHALMVRCAAWTYLAKYDKRAIDIFKTAARTLVKQKFSDEVEQERSVSYETGMAEGLVLGGRYSAKQFVVAMCNQRFEAAMAISGMTIKREVMRKI